MGISLQFDRSEEYSRTSRHAQDMTIHGHWPKWDSGMYLGHLSKIGSPIHRANQTTI